VVASRPATLARRRPRSPSSARFRYSPSTACRNSSVAGCAGSGVRATRVVNFEPRPACAIGRNTAGCGCVPCFRQEELVVALALTGSYLSWFSTNVNTVVFAPMARASVRIATPVKGGERRNMRMAHRRSRAMSLWNASRARFRHSCWWMAIGPISRSAAGTRFIRRQARPDVAFYPPLQVVVELIFESLLDLTMPKQPSEYAFASGEPAHNKPLNRLYNQPDGARQPEPVVDLRFERS
jgi:hypothetical protein